MNQQDKHNENGNNPHASNDTPTRFGAVALIGFTNAGKSSLINHMLGMKLAIVTPKVQTTRYKQAFIVHHNNAQIVFFDTPGIFNPENFFERQLITMMEESIEIADQFIYVIDSKNFKKHNHIQEIKKLLKHKKPLSICFNKTDLVEKMQLLPMVQSVMDTPLQHKKTQKDHKQGHQNGSNDLLGANIQHVFFSSTKDKKGIQTLLDHLADTLPESPFHYNEDMLTDYSMRQVCAEITREKILQFCHKEIPYHCHIVTEDFQESVMKSGPERGNPVMEISQKILVRRKTHKAIVIGKQGQQLKRIGSASRQDIEAITGAKVILKLYVSTQENWPDQVVIEEEM
jgi:GTP-binding protein Era